MMSHRREFLISALSASLSARSIFQTPAGQPSAEEEQAGDPSIPSRSVVFDPVAIDLVVNPGKALGLEKDSERFARQMLKVAEEHVGISASSNRDFVDTLFKVLNVPARKPDGSWQPFCAAGVSFAACAAYCDIDPSKISHDDTNVVRVFRDVLSDINKFYFLPHCATRSMVEDGKKRGRWVSAMDGNHRPQPGWLVFFSWGKNSISNHVGIVRSVDGSAFETVEYNTSSGSSDSQSNGGLVALRDRTAYLSYVMGYVAVSHL